MDRNNQPPLMILVCPTVSQSNKTKCNSAVNKSTSSITFKLQVTVGLAGRPNLTKKQAI